MKIRLPAVLLLGATVFFWSFYERYEPVGPLLLESPSLVDATRCSGEVSESDGRFVLNVSESGKRADVRFRLSAATDYRRIRIRGRVKVEGVVVGKYRWNCARLLLLQYDAQSKWISRHHGMVSKKGSVAWESHEEVFELSPAADHVVVVLQQGGSEGTAEFEQIEAQPVRLRASLSWWRILFAGLWLLAAVFYFPRCRLRRRKLGVLILLNALAILAGTLMPGAWIEEGTRQVKTIWAERGQPEPKEPAIREIRDTGQVEHFAEVVGNAHVGGHFILFASLCFLVYCSAALERQHPIYFLKVGFDVLLFAAVTEVLQFLTLDRQAGLLDLRIDLYGMAAAFLLFLLFLPLFRSTQA